MSGPTTAEKLEALISLKKSGEKVAALTAYDYPTARLVDESGVDLILVGDSLGMVVCGLPDTTGVDMDMMLHHTRISARGVTNALLVADFPYHSYETPEQALENGKRLIEAGAEAVKLEGGTTQLAQVNALVDADIPVVGHIGMLPQRILEEGRYKKWGKTTEEQDRLLRSAVDLEGAGIKAVILEGIVPEVAAQITETISIPTIGIGAGEACDGQIIVLHDLLGAYPWFCPPFAITRADLAGETTRAVKEYIGAVKA